MEIGNEISQQIRVSVLNQLSLKFIGILDYFDYNYVLILNYGQLAINCVLEIIFFYVTCQIKQKILQLFVYSASHNNTCERKWLFSVVNQVHR